MRSGGRVLREAAQAPREGVAKNLGSTRCPQKSTVDL